MIQTDEQYGFVNDCLRLTCSRGLDPVPLEAFIDELLEEEETYPATMFARLEKVLLGPLIDRFVSVYFIHFLLFRCDKAPL